MMQSIITMLCTQSLQEPIDLKKLQVTKIIEDPKYRALDEKVEKYLQKQREKK